MPVLHLGVIDVPYQGEPPSPRKGGRPRKTSTPNMGTGDVADILEAKYKVMETFFEHYQKRIEAHMVVEAEGQLENMLSGAPVRALEWRETESLIGVMFRRFLESKEMDGLGIAGVPTKAARSGASKRFKIKRGPPRPSFIDTGMYESSFIAWFS